MAEHGWSHEKRVRVEGAFYKFLSKCFVNSKDSGRICLGDNLFLGQRLAITEIFNGLEEGIHDFKILKSRQLGISTIFRALAVFFLGIFSGLKGAIVFDTDNNKSQARLELETMIKDLPRSLKFPNIKSNNRAGLTLASDSQVLFMSAGVKKSKSSGTLGRSVGLSVAMCSEMCSWDNDEGVESFKQSLSEVNPDRLYVWESPLALDTPIPRPAGWTTIGKIKTGHHVYDERGNVCRVIGVSPIFTNKKCYQITFGNGETIVADGVHKWPVMERRWPTNPQWKSRIVTTAELDCQNHRIELAKPIKMDDVWLPIEPYFLGVWLGDGRSDSPRITTGDQDIDEIRDRLTKRGHVLGPISKSNWRVGAFTALGQSKVFSNLGLLGNKHIPSLYLRASESQRRELLAGLMDTDGHISPKTFQCTFANTSVTLINGVAELLSSLGIKFKRSVFSVEGKIRTFPNGRTYACAVAERLVFSEHPDYKVFNLTRKASIQNSIRGFTHRKAKYLKIVSVEQVKSVPVKCISVDSQSHLFLVGRTMIPTHNTARGFNQWYEDWQEARKDPLHQKCIFIGFWGKDSQRIDRSHPDFDVYGSMPPTEKEAEKIRIVRERYGVEVTMEILAWYRRKMDPTARAEGDADPEFEGSTTKVQEQPWIEEEAFQQTGAIFFSSEKLTEITRNDVSPKFNSYFYSVGQEFVDTHIIKAPNAKMAELKIWEEPDPDGFYCMGVDPAFGENELNDRSCIQVGRCYADGIDQVAEYACPMPRTEQLAWVMASLMGWYGGGVNAQVKYVLELNGPGDAVFRELKSLKHQIDTRSYLDSKVDDKGLRDVFRNVRSYLYSRADAIQGGMAYHLKTTGSLKITFMERLRDHVTSGRIRIRSLDLVEEMKTIAREGDTIKAPGSMKDDRVLAAAFMVQCWESGPRRFLLASNRTRDSEAARQRLTITDQVNLYQSNQLQYFFAQKRRVRLNAQAQQTRRNWRGR